MRTKICLRDVQHSVREKGLLHSRQAAVAGNTHELSYRVKDARQLQSLAGNTESAGFAALPLLAEDGIFECTRGCTQRCVF